MPEFTVMFTFEVGVKSFYEAMRKQFQSSSTLSAITNFFLHVSFFSLSASEAERTLAS